VAIVAHDIGARVAYRLALDHEDTVERLALLDATPLTHSSGHRFHRSFRRVGMYTSTSNSIYQKSYWKGERCSTSGTFSEIGRSISSRSATTRSPCTSRCIPIPVRCEAASAISAPWRMRSPRSGRPMRSEHPVIDIQRACQYLGIYFSDLALTLLHQRGGAGLDDLHG
jgi:pimeloyl-ACP methyl ester carboxylesterase